MAKKIILIVLGVVLLLCGLGAIVPGTLLAAATGRDNTLESDFHRVGTRTAALVSETAQLSEAGGMRSGLGATTITVTARSAGPPIFLGVAQSSDVDGYLSGIAYDEVRDFELSPFRVETVRHAGSAIATPPGDATFWTASASGPAPTLEWDLTDGDYRLVIMNADGSPGVAADARFGIKVNGLFGIGLGVLIAGIIAAVVGIVLVIFGIRTRTQPRPPPAAGGYPPSGAPPPT